MGEHTTLCAATVNTGLSWGELFESLPCIPPLLVYTATDAQVNNARYLPKPACVCLPQQHWPPAATRRAGKTGAARPVITYQPGVGQTKKVKVVPASDGPTKRYLGVEVSIRGPL